MDSNLRFTCCHVDVMIQSSNTINVGERHVVLGDIPINYLFSPYLKCQAYPIIENVPSMRNLYPSPNRSYHDFRSSLDRHNRISSLSSASIIPLRRKRKTTSITHVISEFAITIFELTTVDLFSLQAVVLYYEQHHDRRMDPKTHNNWP